MFADLLGILRNPELEGNLATELAEMMDDATALVIEGGQYFWGKELSQEDRLKLYGKAEVVADRHRAIRNLMVVHSPLATSTDRAHFLGMINLIREVERLAERAKNLVELARMGQCLPDDDLVRELRQLRRAVEAQLEEVPRTVKQNDARAAQRLEQRGRETISRLDAVVERLASSGDYLAAHAVMVSLGSQTYARIQRQLLNIVQTLITPLHLVDFYDERAPESI